MWSSWVVFSVFLSICYGISCLKKSDCSCEIGGHGGILVNCNERSLTSIPSFELNDLSAQIYEIFLKDNGIQNVTAFSFNGTFLKKLDISNNPLISIANEAFAGIEESLSDLIIGSTSKRTLSMASIPLQSLVSLERLSISSFNDLDVKETYFENLKKLAELSLTWGYLESIPQSAFKAQSDILTKLDLSENKFKDIPMMALSILPNLETLSLTSNIIKIFQEGAFVNLKKLKVLNIDRLNRPIIETGAFRPLAGSLEVLNMATSSFSDLIFGEIKHLTSLTHVYASYNMFSTLERFLDGSLPLLKMLDLQDNQIARIDRLQSDSLEMLILEDNPITDASADAFYGLPSLVSLNLKGAKGLKLDENAFISQTSNLRELRLNQVNLSGTRWKALTALNSIELLEVSRCDFSNVPDFMFLSTPRLKSLILDGNNISSLSQRSFHGLGPSLQQLSLADNNLETLDECVFHNFDSRIFTKLKLDRNPLVCDCRLRWLHEKVQALRKRPETSYLFPLIQWTCIEPNVKFNSLTDDHFKDCAAPEPPACEDFKDLSTVPAATQPIDLLELFVTDVTSNSFVVNWNGSMDENSHYFLSYEKIEGEERLYAHAEVATRTSQQLVTGLEPSTAYRISLTIVSSGSINRTVQTTAVTISWIDEHREQVIVGTAVGATLFVLALLAFFFVFCMYARKPNVPVVEVTNQSKRYIKHNDYHETRRSQASIQADPKEIIKSTLENMSEEEKYRLVNLLTNSRSSINGLDDDFPPRQNRIKHTYEEIPSDIYDEISEDKNV